MSASGNDDDRTQDVVQAVLIIIITAVVAYAGVSALATTNEITGGIGSSGDLEERNITSGSTNLAQTDDLLSVSEVRDSRGNAVAFGSDGGNVTANWSAADNGGALTLSVHIRLDPNASVANTYHILNVGNGTASIQYDDGQYVAVYDNGTNQSRVRATAPEPKNFTHVALRSNGTHIELAVNGSVRNETVLGNGNGALNAEGLFGTIDEVREFDGAITDTTLSELDTDAILGQPSETRTARLMLDERSGTLAPILFSPGAASLEGDAAFADGLNGTIVQQGGNYSVSADGDLDIDSSGFLGDNPVAYVTYEDKDRGAGAITSGYTAVAELLGVVFVVILLGVVVARLNQYTQ